MKNAILKLLRFGEGKKLKILQEAVDAVTELKEEVEKLSDLELAEMTKEFRDRLKEGETLDDLLPEAFAVIREASKRTIGLFPYDVQVMGGIVLHEGKIAEMKTGEGKTLMATMPAYLNALSGDSVHIVTVNDYLAKRDSEWMGPIYRFVGMQVGLLQSHMKPELRLEAYQADIIYGTNSEFGFDYLRDNMVTDIKEKVQKDHCYAIVDEVDSILIDEARTPLIISGPAEKAADTYYKFAKIVPKLKPKIDYEVDEKSRTVVVTETGIHKVEQELRIDNLYDHVNSQLINHLQQAMKAQALFKNDVDYLVKDGEVIIVDEFTGRMMEGRRYSEGLHQAIEAKEGVKIREENQTLATITLQNYFRMYDKLGGMTGTAATQADEFAHVYKLEVVMIPSNKEMQRLDDTDLLYKNEKAKFKAVIDEIIERHQKGQPVLVGTVSIEKSETLSNMLKRKGIPHQVLNAKHHEQEAEIIAQAGRKAAVTIATNMAGRGVDIILGGNPPDEADAEVVKEAGGLHVIGTERHESRRIDNQLRGRSGRQGDPGSTLFFLSLEDDLMRIFGSNKIGSIMERLSFPEDQPIAHGMLSKAVESAQSQVENRNFEARKHVLEYDDVMNLQRDVIYKERDRILRDVDLHEMFEEILTDVIDNIVQTYTDPKVFPENWDLDTLTSYLLQLMPLEIDIKSLDVNTLSQDELEEYIMENAMQAYKKRIEEFGEDIFRELEKNAMLQVLDNRWREHLYELDYLREGIGLRAYGQRDPLVEYKNEAYNMFQSMMYSIKEDFIRYVYHARIVQVAQKDERKTIEGRGETVANAANTNKAPVHRDEDKIGRNDPCHCGSGKKYKKCHGK